MTSMSPCKAGYHLSWDCGRQTSQLEEVKETYPCLLDSLLQIALLDRPLLKLVLSLRNLKRICQCTKLSQYETTAPIPPLVERGIARRHPDL